MFFKTKKSKEIYNLIIAHRGLHNIFPENSMGAYNSAIENKYAIELDIRLTKDNKIVCYHDRYTKRLIGLKGKLSSKNYSEIKDLVIKKSEEKVPLFRDVLKHINGRVAILVEVKGLLTKKFELELIKELEKYNGVVYFHAKNIVTYFKLQKIYKNKVFFILNPFRKRFNFIKSK